MRGFSGHEQKVFRRLRQAFRRAITVVAARKGSADEAKKAIGRITTRAVRIGWLELPNKS